MGCGRVGSAIARRLEDVGHSVAVIDQDPEAFRRLGPDFAGRQVTGLGFDRQTLLDAGIDSAGAFAATGAAGRTVRSSGAVTSRRGSSHPPSDAITPGTMTARRSMRGIGRRRSASIVARGG